MEGVHQPKPAVKRYRRRQVQYKLSQQNVIMLLGICLFSIVALGVLYYFWDTGETTSSETQMVRVTYETMFREVGRRYELDWRILARQAYRESGFDPYVVGGSQDTGLMQIIPATWDEWAPQVGVSDPFDPYSNLLVGAAYLAFLRDHFAGMGYTDERWMLVAYNWGPYNLQQHLENGRKWTQVPKKQRRYTLSILQEKSELPPGWENVRDDMVLMAQPLK